MFFVKTACVDVSGIGPTELIVCTMIQYGVVVEVRGELGECEWRW